MLAWKMDVKPKMMMMMMMMYKKWYLQLKNVYIYRLSNIY